jgi:hypothetical protein
MGVARGNSSAVSGLSVVSSEVNPDGRWGKKSHLYVFICGESPTQLGGEGRFSNSPLPTQYQDFPFYPCEPLVDHRDRCRVLDRRFCLARRTDVLVRTSLACIHLARQVGFRAWTVVGCVCGHVRGLLHSDHVGEEEWVK